MLGPRSAQWRLALVCIIFPYFDVGVAEDDKPAGHADNTDAFTAVGWPPSVIVHGKKWLQGGDVAFRHSGKLFSWYAGNLTLSKKMHSDGLDELGSFTEAIAYWEGGGVSYTTIVRQYKDSPTIAFEQRFPDGADAIAVPEGWRCINKSSPVPNIDPWLGCDFDGVATAFPSFLLGSADDSETKLGFMQYVGAHLDDSHNSTSRGPWLGRLGKDHPATGLSAGPMAVFSVAGNAVVIGPAVSPMASSMAWGSRANEMQWGVLGSARNIPKGFQHIILLQHGFGLVNTWRAWGKAVVVLQNNEIQRPLDFTATHLGYQTDNGAYLYYQPNAIEGLYRVQEDAVARRIPIQFAHLDSWWYWKSNESYGGGGVPPAGGTLNWTAMPTVVPGGNAGLHELHKKTGWPLSAHNRWWSNKTQYSSNFTFWLGSGSRSYPGIGMALPQMSAFWNFLFVQAKEWGLIAYEQDWLWTNWLGLPAALEELTVASTWLQQMALAAKVNGITIMYCMALPRMLLSAAGMDAVTQIRVSDDYGLAAATGGMQQQWRIGRSSLLADAVGLRPFKDGFLSNSSKQEGGHLPNYSAPFPQLQAVVATYSTGGVMPGDGPGYLDAELLSRSCRADGVLLQPSRPAVVLDRFLIDEAFGLSEKWNGSHHTEVWATASAAGHMHVLAADLQERLALTLWDLAAHAGKDAAPDGYVAYRILRYGTGRSEPVELRRFGGEVSTLPLEPKPLPDFEVWHLAPIVDGRWALLGEISKWVPTSVNRFNLSLPGEEERACGQVIARRWPYGAVLWGAPGENVTIWIAEEQEQDNQWIFRGTTCQLTALGCSVLDLPELLCLGSSLGPLEVKDLEKGLQYRHWTLYINRTTGQKRLGLDTVVYPHRGLRIFSLLKGGVLHSFSGMDSDNGLRPDDFIIQVNRRRDVDAMSSELHNASELLMHLRRVEASQVKHEAHRVPPLNRSNSSMEDHEVDEMAMSVIPWWVPLVWFACVCPMCVLVMWKCPWNDDPQAAAETAKSEDGGARHQRSERELLLRTGDDEEMPRRKR